MATADLKTHPLPLSKEDAAKRVKCTPAEVLDFKDYGTHVVVVSVDGQKRSDLAA